MILKKLKNNKGMTAIHYVIIMMIIFYFIAFLLDVADVSMKKYAAIRQLTTVSRVVGRQGGIVSSSTLNNWKTTWGVNQNYDASDTFFSRYIDRVTLFNSLAETFKDCESWELKINGQNLYTDIPSSISPYDYATSMNVQLTIQYRWKTLPKILPIVSDSPVTFSLNRQVVSEAFVRNEQGIQ